MSPIERQSGISGSLIAVLLVATAEALCQERQAEPAEAEDAQPQRRIVVSIPDRKLALIEDGRVVKVYPTAVGRPISPTPQRHFTIVQRISNPACTDRAKLIAPAQSNRTGHALARAEPARAMAFTEPTSRAPSGATLLMGGAPCATATSRTYSPPRCRGRSGGTAWRARCGTGANFWRGRSSAVP